MTRLFREGFGLQEVSWLEEARSVAPPTRLSGRVALPVWQGLDLGGYGHLSDDLPRRLGLVNIVDMRYPHVKINALSGNPDFVASRRALPLHRRHQTDRGRWAE